MGEATVYELLNNYMETYLTGVLKGYVKIKNTSSAFNNKNNRELQNQVIDYFMDFIKGVNLKNSSI
jgi:hypothetical protein